MRIHQRLLFGASIQNQGKVQADLYEQTLSGGYYVLVYTAPKSLELYSFRALKYNGRTIKENGLIVGVAKNKAEAYDLVFQMMDQIHALSRYESVAQYLEAELGVV